MTITVTTNVSGDIENLADVVADQYNSNPQDSHVKLVTSVLPSADLSILKSGGPNPVYAGSSLYYAITPINAGPSTAAGVVITDTLPASMRIDTVIASKGTVSIVDNTVTVTIGTLDPLEQQMVQMLVTPLQPGALTNTASISADTRDPDPDNNSSSATVTVLPSADVAVTKSVTPGSVAVGGDVNYTVVVSNNGPSTATLVSGVDTILGCMRYTTATVTRGTADVTDTSMSFELGDMAPGDVTTITLVSTPCLTGTLENMVTVGSPTHDPIPSNNTATVQSEVTPTIVTQIVDDHFTSVVITPPQSIEGWTIMAMNTPGLAWADWNQSSATLVCNVAANPTKFRNTGFYSNYDQWMPYAFVGTRNYVRAKYYVFAYGQANPQLLNQIPNMRLRAANRFAIASVLEVFNHLNMDGLGNAVSEELRPSADPTKPSIYRCDYDPVDVPNLTNRPELEGIMRGFEAYCLEPQENGQLALAESTLGVYPAAALNDCDVPFKVYAPTPTGPGNLGVSDPTELQMQRVIVSPQEGVFPVVDTTTAGLVYTEGPFGITMDTTQVPTTVTGIISREFAPDAQYSTILRVEEDKQYKVRFHVTSTQQSKFNSMVRLRARSIKFAWAQRYEVGGAYAAGSFTNQLAQQALPGIGCLNPDKNGTENGGWYTLLMYTPMSRDIRPEFPPGTPLAIRMPNICAQPGPGVDLPSRRDVRFGADVLDTISTNLLRDQERGNFTIDRIEIRQYQAIID